MERCERVGFGRVGFEQVDFELVGFELAGFELAGFELVELVELELELDLVAGTQTSRPTPTSRKKLQHCPPRPFVVKLRGQRLLGPLFDQAPVPQQARPPERTLPHATPTQQEQPSSWAWAWILVQWHWPMKMLVQVRVRPQPPLFLARVLSPVLAGAWCLPFYYATWVLFVLFDLFLWVLPWLPLVPW